MTTQVAVPPQAAGPQLLVSFVPASVGPARQALADDLTGRGFGRRFVDDAMLVMSEMLSNALKHARPLPDCGQVRMGWVVQSDDEGRRSVLLMVSDGGGSTRPIVLASGRSDTGGRGMGIVETLTESWGCSEDDGATTVWARLADKATPESDRSEGLYLLRH